MELVKRQLLRGQVGVVVVSIEFMMYPLLWNSALVSNELSKKQETYQAMKVMENRQSGKVATIWKSNSLVEPAKSFDIFFRHRE